MPQSPGGGRYPPTWLLDYQEPHSKCVSYHSGRCIASIIVLDQILRVLVLTDGDTCATILPQHTWRVANPLEQNSDRIFVIFVFFSKRIDYEEIRPYPVYYLIITYLWERIFNCVIGGLQPSVEVFMEFGRRPDTSRGHGASRAW